jgi:excisionase family DNA binding protein
MLPLDRRIEEAFEMIDLLNLNEVAKELRISIHTVRAWVFQERFPVVRLGRRVLLRRSDLEAFVNKNVVEAKQGK